jgi:hypothetical protein
MAWLLFWKIFVHYSSPGLECFAEDIVFVPFFSSWKVQSLDSRCWCRVWRFCRRERESWFQTVYKTKELDWS